MKGAPPRTSKPQNNFNCWIGLGVSSSRQFQIIKNISFKSSSFKVRVRDAKYRFGLSETRVGNEHDFPLEINYFKGKS